MGSIAIVTSTQALTAVGAGLGGLAVSAALIYLLAYLELLDASDTNRSSLRLTLIAAIIPLIVAFGGLVVFNSLKVADLTFL